MAMSSAAVGSLPEAEVGGLLGPAKELSGFNGAASMNEAEGACTGEPHLA